MSITGLQAQAARALLGNIKAEEVYSYLEMTAAPYYRFENGTGGISAKNKEKLVRYFENRGCEFMPGGVRVKPQAEIVQLEGLDGFDIFMQDVRKTALNPDVDICVSGVDESLFEKWQGKNAGLHIATMESIHAQSPFSFRILISDADDYKTASGYAQYKKIPNESFSPIAVYVYGDKKAEIIFEPDNVLVIITTSAVLANAYRKTFNHIWGSLA